MRLKARSLDEIGKMALNAVDKEMSWKKSYVRKWDNEEMYYRRNVRDKPLIPKDAEVNSIMSNNRTLLEEYPKPLEQTVVFRDGGLFHSHYLKYHIWDIETMETLDEFGHAPPSMAERDREFTTRYFVCDSNHNKPSKAKSIIDKAERVFKR